MELKQNNKQTLANCFDPKYRGLHPIWKEFHSYQLHIKSSEIILSQKIDKK